MENSTPKNESEVFWYHVKVWGIRNVAILPGSEFRSYISKLIILFKGGESTAHSMLLLHKPVCVHCGWLRNTLNDQKQFFMNE